MSVAALDRVTVEGHVATGFEGVRETFAENFARRHELGGACCAYHRGEEVVDLWGGIRNKETGKPWERDIMVIVYSATKGLAWPPVLSLGPHVQPPPDPRVRAPPPLGVGPGRLQDCYDEVAVDWAIRAVGV